MNLLMVGRGKGSWEMRGQQLGAVLGARVTSDPTEADWHWADRVVLVKREVWSAGWRRPRALRIPIVWDALDFWSQPLDNRHSEANARDLVRRALETLKPDLTIGATEAMAAATGGVYLSHHSRIGLVPTAARERFQVIGYDGNPGYLDTWRPALERLCLRRGWTFVINPRDLGTVDLLVALRGGIWDGWMCREWKSGVKLVNAIAAGRPIVTQDTAAWRELQPAGSVVTTVADLPEALDRWVPYDRRQAVVEISRGRAPQFTVEAIAARYRALLGVTSALEVSC